MPKLVYMGRYGFGWTLVMINWCCWCAVGDALKVMHWCCWSADAADAPLLMHWCCWCAEATNALILCWWCFIYILLNIRIPWIKVNPHQCWDILHLVWNRYIVVERVLNKAKPNRVVKEGFNHRLDWITFFACRCLSNYQSFASTVEESFNFSIFSPTRFWTGQITNNHFCDFSTQDCHFLLRHLAIESLKQ